MSEDVTVKEPWPSESIPELAQRAGAGRDDTPARGEDDPYTCWYYDQHEGHERLSSYDRGRER